MKPIGCECSDCLTCNGTAKRLIKRIADIEIDFRKQLQHTKELEAENQELKNYIGYHLSGEQKEQQIKELETENDKLKSHLSMFFNRTLQYMRDRTTGSQHALFDALDTTSSVSLAHIQREAIEKAIDAAEDYDGGAGMITRFMAEYAEQLTKESE